VLPSVFFYLGIFLKVCWTTISCFTFKVWDLVDDNFLEFISYAFIFRTIKVYVMYIINLRPLLWILAPPLSPAQSLYHTPKSTHSHKPHQRHILKIIYIANTCWKLYTREKWQYTLLNVLYILPVLPARSVDQKVATGASGGIVRNPTEIGWACVGVLTVENEESLPLLLLFYFCFCCCFCLPWK